MSTNLGNSPSGTIRCCQIITLVISWYYDGNTSGEIMTLTVKLAEQDQNRLEAIAAVMKAGSQSDVIRILINEKFESLQADKTLVERRGGHPEYLLAGTANLSERITRKGVIAAKLAAKASRRVK